MCKIKKNKQLYILILCLLSGLEDHVEFGFENIKVIVSICIFYYIVL